MIREAIRILFFLLLLAFYALTTPGHYLAVAHFVLFLIAPSSFGMSRVMMKIVDFYDGARKKSFSKSA